MGALEVELRSEAEIGPFDQGDERLRCFQVVPPRVEQLPSFGSHPTRTGALPPPTACARVEAIARGLDRELHVGPGEIESSAA